VITNTGKNILAKYLVGQAPAYASYIAVGCGSKPLASNYTFSSSELADMQAKETLDFEMFRVPIISRGYVTENGTPKIVLTAELPTEERYEISEVGVYSAGSNPSAGTNDSKTIYAFTQNENWEYHSATSATSIPIIYEPLDPAEDNVIDVEAIRGEDTPVFQTNADNRVFTDQDRTSRYERCRFLNNIVALRGDSSTMSLDLGGHLVVDSGDHIHLNGVALDFNRNAPTDQIKLAFSVINKDGDAPSGVVPENVKLLLEFASEDVFGAGEFARLEINLDNGTESDEHDFSSNRYVVVTRQLQDLYKSAGFSWNSVNIVKAYTSVTYQGQPSDQFYVCLDAARFENITDVNPLYGLTGYSVIKNADDETIIKRSNTTNFIEFRFSMDVA
jgi:hypothetical protein